MNLRRIGAVAVVMGLAIAACGKAAEVVAPGLAVRHAAHSTFDAHRARLAFSLVGDEADVATLFQAPAGEDREFVDLFRTSRVIIAMDGGQDEASAADDDRMALEIDLGDIHDAVEMRVVDKTLYLRGDVERLAEFEASPEDLAEVVAGAREAGLDFVGDAFAGRWLSMDLAPLEAMSKGMVEERGGEVPDFGADQLNRMLEAVTRTFGEDVDVKRLDQEDAGEHYRLTVPVRRVYERLMPVIGELFSVPGMAELPPAAEVPDKTISLDVWVADGRISRVEFDLGQFAPEPPAGRVALRVDVDRPDGDIKAPDGAVAVNAMEIFGQLMSGLGAIPS